MIFTESLKKNYQFRQVYNRGKSLANRYIVVYIYPNSLKANRLGVSVSKKVGKSVVRSRVSRLIKESYRSIELGIKKGYDIVVIARSASATAGFHDITGALAYLLGKHNIVEEVQTVRED